MAYDINAIIAEYGDDDFGFSSVFDTVSESWVTANVLEPVKVWTLKSPSVVIDPPVATIYLGIAAAPKPKALAALIAIAVTLGKLC